MNQEKVTALEKLKAQQKKLQARIQKMEALEKVRERKKDTRRKILIGAYCLDKAQREGTLEGLYQVVREYLSRESDKVLFGEDVHRSETSSS